MKKIGLFITLILALISSHQSTNPLTTALAKFNTEYPQEKVFLHFDKPYYYANEDLWFKAYLVAGADHLPSAFSDILYTELINDEGELIKRNKILLQNGFGPGDFELTGLTSGNYTIRAYTHWMRNFDPDFFFQKQLAIISPIDGNPSPKDSDETLSLSFFPEGGDLISGIENHIAAEAMATGKIGSNQTIEIFNNDRELLVTFKTNDNGHGSFLLSPQQGKTYYAIISGVKDQFDLPQARTEGYAIQIQNEKSSTVDVQIVTNQKKQHKLYAIVQTRGMITYASQIDFSEKAVNVSIPKKDLMSGISHLTIFNEQWQPEAERLFFHMANDQLQIQVTTDQSIYKSRDKATIKIKVSDAAGKPVQGSFSLSAVDANQINASLDEENILSNLLLTSDIKGYIKNPGQFFKAGALQHTAQLDLIMMTHGWRRFTWKDLLADQYPDVNYGVEQGIAIQGTLLNPKNGEPIVGGTISHMGTFNEVPSIANTESLDDGFFVLGNLYFYENEENYLKGEIKSTRKKKKVKEVYVQIDSTARTFPEVSIQQIPLAGLSAEVIEDHIDKSIERQKALINYEFAEEARDLGTVVVEGVRAEETEKFGQQYSSLDFDDYVKYTQYGANALQLVSNRLPNVQMRGHGASLQPILTYNTTIRAPNLNPLVLLDGHPITFAQLRVLPAARIKKAEVYRGTQHLLRAGREAGDVLRGGVLEFTSRTDEEMLEYYKKLGSKNAKTLPGGLYETRAFYAPKYYSKERMNPLPDKRMVIFWEPMITTDANGEAEVLFFNGDLATTIQLDIQGMSLTGIPGMAKATYEVVNTTGASK